jgi:DNA-binding IclR family transcriptional regulator
MDRAIGVTKSRAHRITHALMAHRVLKADRA